MKETESTVKKLKSILKHLHTNLFLNDRLHEFVNVTNQWCFYFSELDHQSELSATNLSVLNQVQDELTKTVFHLKDVHDDRAFRKAGCLIINDILLLDANFRDHVRLIKLDAPYFDVCGLSKKPGIHVNVLRMTAYAAQHVLDGLNHDQYHDWMLLTVQPHADETELKDHGTVQLTCYIANKFEAFLVDQFVLSDDHDQSVNTKSEELHA